MNIKQSQKVFSLYKLIRRCASTEALAADLKHIVGTDNVTNSAAVREQHNHDESYHVGRSPDVVVYTRTTKEVSQVVKYCAAKCIPIIPFGTGTGLEGGVTAMEGGVCLDLSRMDKVLQVNPEDFDCTVQAGVTRNALNSFIRDTGLQFPIDPGANASLGGMCATSASGTMAVRYGTMRENVMNLEVVLADGTIIKTAGLKGRSRKTSAGYNLTNLFVGQEGTLGIITEATLKLHATPEAVLSAVAPFKDLQGAVNATVAIMQSGLPVARIEFLDENMVDACNRFSKLDLDVAPTLFLEFHGSKNNIEAQGKTAEETCKSFECLQFIFTTDIDRRNDLWKARHNVWYAAHALRPGSKCYSTDVCVPISSLPGIIAFSRDELRRLKLLGLILGHVGDGNFHVVLVIDPKDLEEIKRVHEFSIILAKEALRMNGTITGEHGIGLGKKQLLIDEFGLEGINTMKFIKKALDPLNILNPGKIIIKMNIIRARTTHIPNIFRSLTQRYASSQTLVADLKQIVGNDNVSNTAAVREQHSHDESYHAGHAPDVVAFAQSTDHVSQVVKYCAAKRIPIIPFGTGTGLEGGVTALQGGVTLNLSRMDRVLQVNPEDFDCIVQAGVTRNALNSFIRDTGLQFPIDPGANASLGGMCATSASGTMAVRYGTMRENVMNLEVVLADGTIIKTAGLKGRSRKTSAGYNLTNLFVGQEGTLGIITEATLKLHATPEAVLSAVAPFKDFQGAVNATVAIMQSGLPVARIEFLDENMVDACNRFSKLGLDVAPTLFLEFHGSNSNIETQGQIAEETCKSYECLKFDFATDPEKRSELWKARHSAWYAAQALKPGSKGYSTDVCVPISALPGIVTFAKDELKRLNLLGPIVGHVGDGNFHVFVIVDPKNPKDMDLVHEYSVALAKEALRVNGTVTGEHGIGLGKKKLLVEEFGPSGINTMKAIKQALDPLNILNPGKVL
ncbi:unnamed protein product [Rotaria socialis]|uniref:Probable D-lactate dehydrogenase, mitochondrial n=2 Tax=Rotaria socialis TaxID=392032 RepID=A0A817Q024_9BILA|nr:unnamed protein product [Rotaria socialis]